MEDNRTILVINAGSSSLKYKVFTYAQPIPLAEGLIERIGLDYSPIKHTKFENNKELEKKIQVVCHNHEDAMKEMMNLLKDKDYGVIKSEEDIVCIGHRVVHGVDIYSNPTLITEDVIKIVEQYSFLAPLHNPPNLLGIKTAIKLFKNAKQVGIFDTAFH